MNKKQRNFASSVTLAIVAAVAAGAALLFGFNNDPGTVSLSPAEGGLGMFLPMTAAFILMLIVGFAVYYVLMLRKPGEKD